MSYELATQRACEAYYGDAQSTPGAIVQAVLALLAAFGVCPPATAKRSAMTFPRIARLRLLATSYRMHLPEGVDRNELVDLGVVLATQSTEAEYAAFFAEKPPEAIKALLPN